MEIRIDTNKDSKEHIQQMIEFLQRFVGSQSSAPPSNGMTGMFGDASAPSEGMLGLFHDDSGDAPRLMKRDDQEPEERLEIIPY